jgi:carboxyl-terminal processing protease
MNFRIAFSIALALSAAGAYAQAPAPAAGAAPQDNSEAATSPAHKRKQAAFPLKPTTVEDQAAQISARFLTTFHYHPQPLDDSMSAKIYKAYFDALDGEKVFFTQADMDKFAPMKTTLDDDIWGSNLTAPFDVFNQYITRAVDRMTYARGLLKQGFDFNAQDSFNFDRKNAAWPKDQAELDDLWRKRTMNDWMRLKLAGKPDDEIRKTLDKRYANYIERVKQLDQEDAFQTFMTAYAVSTDPHTDYFGERAGDAFDLAMKLSLEGIGAMLQGRDDYTVISELLPGTPAQKSGQIAVGDRIVGVGQGATGPIVDVVGWRQDDVVSLIRGKRDTVVRLEILPASAGMDGKHKIVSLTRKKVTMADQAAKKRIIEFDEAGVHHKVGIIDLPSFYEDFGARSSGDANFKSATRDVDKLLTELKAAKVEGVVVDLRNNGGGSLSEAADMTGLFIDQGPVVQIRDAHGQIEVQGDTKPGTSWDGPLAVMVNRGSASASEIFAAAIQDYGRGVIVGVPTFGKGTVQNVVDLDKFGQGDPNAKYGELKMTIAQFFRINGGSTQMRGVTPEVMFPSSGDEKDLGESTYDNALPWSSVPAAKYAVVGDIKPLAGPLQAKHDARVAQSPAWKLMLDELAAYKKARDDTTVSLNFAAREAQRKQVEAQQADFRARHKAIDGGKGKDTPDDLTSDDGLQADERNINPAQISAEIDAAKAKDPQVAETAHIVIDEAALQKK